MDKEQPTDQFESDTSELPDDEIAYHFLNETLQICKICHTDFPISMWQCPQCGIKSALWAETTWEAHIIDKLFKDLPEPALREGRKMDGYLNKLMKAQSLEEKAECFFNIGKSYRRIYRRNPLAWMIWMVYCRDLLLEVAKTKKVNHLVLEANNAIATYYLYMEKNVFTAMEFAEKSLEYEALCLNDHNFVPLNLGRAHKIMAECYEIMGDAERARLSYIEAERLMGE